MCCTEPPLKPAFMPFHHQFQSWAQLCRLQKSKLFFLAFFYQITVIKLWTNSFCSHPFQGFFASGCLLSLHSVLILTGCKERNLGVSQACCQATKVKLQLTKQSFWRKLASQKGGAVKPRDIWRLMDKKKNNRLTLYFNSGRINKLTDCGQTRSAAVLAVWPLCATWLFCVLVGCRCL